MLDLDWEGTILPDWDWTKTPLVSPLFFPCFGCFSTSNLVKSCRTLLLPLLPSTSATGKQISWQRLAMLALSGKRTSGSGLLTLRWDPYVVDTLVIDFMT